MFWSYVAEDERPITLYHIDNYDSDENMEEEEEKDSDDSDWMCHYLFLTHVLSQDAVDLSACNHFYIFRSMKAS